jgi:TP901 family phage tail tape measure protein
MADLEKTVKIIFAGEDSELSKTVLGVAKKFDDFSAPLEKISQTLSGFADKVIKVDAVLAGLVVGGMALAINESGKFGGSFREISTLIDASSADIGKFREDVLIYAQSSGKSIEDINQSIYKAVSAGISYKDVMGALASAEKLSIAGRNDLASTTVLLAGTMNAYGASANQAGHYSDVFMETVRRGLTTLPDLAGSLANVTGIASMGKVPIETLSAAIAALTATGIPTEQAITGMKNVIANIIKPTDEAAKMAASLGIQFNAAALQTKGLEAVLWDAWRATNGNAESMNTLFGSIRGLNAATILASDSSGRFKETLAAMQNVAGTTDEAYKKMAGGFTEVNQNLKNNIAVLLIDIGDKLMPAYKEAGRGLSNIFKDVKIAVDAGAFDPLFNLLADAGSKLSTWLSGVAKALPEALTGLDFSKLISALKGLAGAFSEYLGGLDLTQVDDLHKFIQGLIDGIAGLIKVTEGMVEGFRPFFTVIVEFLKSAAQSDEQTQKVIGTVLALGKMVEAFGIGMVAAATVIDQYKVSIDGFFNVVGGSARVTWNVIQGVFDAITGALVILAGSFLSLVDSLSFGLLTDQLADSKTKLTQWGMDISKSIAENAHDSNQGLSKIGEGLKQLIYDSGDTKKAVDETSGSFEKIDETAQGAARSFGSISEEVKKTQTSVTNAGTAVKGLGDQLKTVGTIEIGDKIVEVKAVADNKSITSAKDEVNKIPAEKKIDVNLETAKIKEQSAIIQKGIEWTAKVNIAQAEEATKRLKDMLSSIDTGIKSTGDLLGSLFGNLGSEGGRYSYEIMEQVRKENERRDQEFALQEKLINQQAQMNELKIRQMQEGNYVVQVAASGLKPHLEMILWEILTAIQLRANEESAEFLLGIK